MENDVWRSGAISASGLVLDVGGFSDAVFSVVAAFLVDDSGRFVADVENVEL
jgi:hypothetical protein